MKRTENKIQSDLSITEAALKKIQDLRDEYKVSEDRGLRIWIEGGGCSGFRYGFAFDNFQDDDLLYEEYNIQLFVDPISMQRIKNSIIDFVDDFRGSGFRVRNPNVSGTCGCGQSFSV